MSTSKVKSRAAKSNGKSKSVLPPSGHPEHKPGSRKGKVHELFDLEGPEVAWTYGLKQGLKETTLHSWIAYWRRMQQPTSKPKVVTVAKLKTEAPAKPKAGAAEVGTSDQTVSATS